MGIKKRILGLLTILLFISNSCIKKKTGIEHWIKSENQNGHLSGFMVTQDYCSLLEQETKEWKELKELYDRSVKRIQRIRGRNLDSLENKIAIATEIIKATAFGLDDFMHDMIAEVRGYCQPKFISLPALPYRKKDMKEFWEEYNNQTSYLRILKSYNSQMYSLVKVNSIIYLNDDEDIQDFKKMNNVQALIHIIEVQHKILDLFDRAEKILLETPPVEEQIDVIEI